MRIRGLLTPVLMTVLGLFLSVILTETVLQIGAAVVRVTGQDARSGFGTGHRRIVALGDSNTYGLYLERNQAYPMVLERLWNESESEEIEVLNLGFPGTNSSQVRRHIPRVLAEMRPDLVTVMVGANDVWTAPVPYDDALDERSSLRQFLQRNSRTYKLLYILRRAFYNPKLEVAYIGERSAEQSSGRAKFGSVEFELGHQKRIQPSSTNPAAALQDNLEAIAALCREAGADFYLLAYHTNNKAYGIMNPIIRKAAKISHAHLVDLYPVFERACPDQRCASLLFLDNHPTIEGQTLIAQFLRQELRETWAP